LNGIGQEPLFTWEVGLIEELLVCLQGFFFGGWGDDVWWWNPEEDGVFSVRSSYKGEVSP